MAKSTVETYRVRSCKQRSPTWKTFLKNHVQDLVALDFFIVPTVTHKMLFVLLILAHDRRQVVHFNVTEHPTAEWTAQQVVDAFPWDEVQRSSGISCAIGTASMALPFGSGYSIWGSRKP